MKRFHFLIAVLLTVSSPGISQVFTTENGRVEFLSQAALNEFTGKSSNLNGLVDLDKNLLDFYVDLNTLNTGIGLRDRHMRENYLETKKYPYAEFTGKINAVPSLKSGQSRSVTAKGTFKIHGVEKEVQVPGKLTALSDTEMQLDASFIVLLGDYNIDIPKVVFYELAEEQEVTIKAILNSKK